MPQRLSLEVDLDLVLQALKIDASPVTAAVQQALVKAGAGGMGIVPDLKLKQEDLSRLTAEVAAALRAGTQRGLQFGSSVGVAGATGIEQVRLAQFLERLLQLTGGKRVAGPEQFSQDALTRAAESSAAFKSKEKLIYMSPDQFLAMSEKFTPDPQKLAAIRSALASGQALSDVPFLQIGRGKGGVADVTGHEGRHRAMVLREMGFQEMPVVLRATGVGGAIRWDQQGRPGAFDYVSEWPTTLRGQGRPDTIPFPVSREDAGAQFVPGGKAPDLRQTQLLTEYLRRREASLGAQVPMSEVLTVAREVSTLAADKIGSVYAAAGTKERLQAERVMSLLTGGEAPSAYKEGQLSGRLSQPAIEKSPTLRAAQEAGQRIREIAGSSAAQDFDTRLAAQVGARVTAYQEAQQLQQFGVFGDALKKLPDDLARRFAQFGRGEIGAAAFTPEERRSLAELQPVFAQVQKSVQALSNATAGLPKKTQPTGRMVDPAAEADRLRPVYEAVLGETSRRLREAAEQKKVVADALQESGLKTVAEKRSDPRFVEAENVLRSAERAQRRASKRLEKLDAMEEAVPYRERVRIAPQANLPSAESAAQLAKFQEAFKGLNAKNLPQIEAGFSRVEEAARRSALAARSAAEQYKTAASVEGQRIYQERTAAADRAQQLYERARSARTQPQPEAVLRGLEDEVYGSRAVRREEATLLNARRRLEQLGPLAQRGAADLIAREQELSARVAESRRQLETLQAQPATAATAAQVAQIRRDVTSYRGDILGVSKEVQSRRQDLLSGVRVGDSTQAVRDDLDRLSAALTKVQRQMLALDPGSQAFKGLQTQTTSAIDKLNRLQAELRQTEATPDLQLRGQQVGQVARQLGGRGGLQRQVDRVAREASEARYAATTRGQLEAIPRVTPEAADTFLRARGGLFRALGQERRQLQQEMRVLSDAGDTASSAYSKLATRLDAVRKATLSAADASRRFKTDLNSASASAQRLQSAQRGIAAVGGTGIPQIDALSARYAYGQQVVTAAGGIGNVARSERAIRDRADLPYAIEYLQARKSDISQAIDIELASGEKTREAQQRLANLRKEALQYGDAIRRAQQGLTGHNAVLQQASNLMRMFLRYSVGYAALYKGLYAVTGLARNIVDLNQALTSIQAVVQATDSEMRTIETSIKRVALATKFTTNEIAAAALILGQAGVLAKDFPSVLASVSQFAAATESSLEISADLFSTMRNVFSELQDSQIANQLTRAVNISKLTSEDLKTILSLSAQMASAYNVSSEQYLAAVTTLRNAGIKASTVATGLRQGLIEIFAPDAKTLKILEERYAQLGEKLTGEQIQSRFFAFSQGEAPLLDAIGELRRLGYGGTGEGVFAGRTFDVRAENAIKGLVRQYEQLQAAEAKITFGEAAAEGAATQLESISNSLKNLGAAITATSYDLASDTLPVIEDLIDATTEWVKGIQQAHEELKLLTGEGLGSSFRSGLLAAVTAFATSRSGNLAVRLGQGAAAGVVGGVAAGETKQRLSEAGASEEVVGAGELAAAGGLGYLFGGGLKKMADRAAAAAAPGAQLGPIAARLTKFLPALTTSATAVGSAIGTAARALSAIPKLAFGPIGFFALMAAEAFGVFDWAGKKLASWVSGTKDSEEQRLKEEIKQGLDTANQARTRRLGEYLDTEKGVASLRPTLEGSGYAAKEGSLPDVLSRQVERYIEAERTLEELFSGRTDSEYLLIQRVLANINKYASDVGGSAFGEQLELLEGVLGRSISDFGLTRTKVAELSNTVGRVTQQGRGIIEEILREYNTLAQKTDRTDLQEIKFTAYEKAISKYRDIREAVQEGGELTDRQLRLLYEAVVSELQEVSSADWGKLNAGNQADLNRSIESAAKEVVSAYYQAGESISQIGSAFQTMVDLVRDHGDAGWDALQRQIRAYDQSATQLETQVREAEERRGSTFGRLFAPSLATISDWRKQAREARGSERRLSEDAARARKAGESEFARGNEEVRVAGYTTQAELQTILLRTPEVAARVQQRGGSQAELLSRFFDLETLKPVSDGFERLHKLQLEQVDLQNRLNTVIKEDLSTKTLEEKKQAEAAIKELEVRLQSNVSEQGKVQGSLPLTEIKDGQTGRVRLKVSKGLEDALNLAKGVESQIKQETEHKYEAYVESDLEREMQRRVFELRLASDKLKDQRKYSEAMGAAQEAYALEVRLAQKELAFMREALERSPPSTDKEYQQKKNAIAKKEQDIRELQYRAAKESYDLQITSATESKKRLEGRLKTLQEVMASQLATPAFTDWGQFSSLHDQYDEVLSQLIAAIRSEGALRGATADEIAQEILALQASGSSLQALTKAFDESAKFLKDFRAAYETLLSPDVITSGTNEKVAIRRLDYGTREPASARLKSLGSVQGVYENEYQRLVALQDRQAAELGRGQFTSEADRAAAVTSLKVTQDQIQDVAKGLAEVREAVRRASLDINGELAEGFNVEAIMDNLREQVEGTVGELGEKVQDAFSTFFSDVSDTLVDFAFGDLEEDLGTSLDNVAKDFAKSLAKSILKAYLDKAIYGVVERLTGRDRSPVEPATPPDAVAQFQALFDKPIQANQMTVSAGSVTVNGPLGEGLRPTPYPGAMVRPEDYGVSSNLPDFTRFADHYVADGPYKGLSIKFANQLDQLFSAARAEGIDLGVSSGLRTPEDTRRIFAGAVKKYGSVEEARRHAAQGYSVHESGFAADISVPNEKAAKFLAEQGPKYGLSFPVATERPDTYKASGHTHVHAELAGARQAIKAGQLPSRPPAGTGPEPAQVAAAPAAERAATELTSAAQQTREAATELTSAAQQLADPKLHETAAGRMSKEEADAKLREITGGLPPSSEPLLKPAAEETSDALRETGRAARDFKAEFEAEAARFLKDQAAGTAAAEAAPALVDLQTIQSWERSASLPMPGTSLDDELAQRTLIRDRVQGELNRATAAGITAGPAVDSLEAALSLLTARIDELRAALSGAAPAPGLKPTGPEVGYFQDNTRSGAPRRPSTRRIAGEGEGQGSVSAEGIVAASVQPASVSAPVANVSGTQVIVQGGGLPQASEEGLPKPLGGALQGKAVDGHEQLASSAQEVAGALGKASSDIAQGGEGIAKGGQKVEAESGGLVSGLEGVLGGFQGFVGSLGGLLGMLSRDFPGVGKAVQGVQLVGTILGGFGFRRGGVVKAATGAVLDDKGVPIPDIMVKAATGAVLDDGAGQPPLGAVVRHYQSVKGQDDIATEQWDKKEKSLRQAFLARLRGETGLDEAKADGPAPGEKERRDGVVRAAAGRVVAMGRRLSSGLLQGRGTGTSDSIPGVIVNKDGKLQGGISVSTGESILTAKATSALGAPFINWVNSNASRFSEGGLLLPEQHRESLVPLFSVARPDLPTEPAESRSGEALRELLEKGGRWSEPRDLRLTVSDNALHRTLKDYLEDYFRDVVATR